MAKKKYYVVWSGKRTGIFTSWEECKKQVIGVKGAKYKSYDSEEKAKKAFYNGAPINGKQETKKPKNDQLSLLEKETPNYIENSISVDAACSGNPGMMEYRGVCTKDGRQIFHFGPVPNGTNNIGEFLAIVHALALLKKKNSTLPIYSDSATAISWVRKKHANTTLKRNKETEKIWDLIDRASSWLHNHSYSNKLMKWETHIWGEIKADFGRK